MKRSRKNLILVAMLILAIICQSIVAFATQAVDLLPDVESDYTPEELEVIRLTENLDKMKERLFYSVRKEEIYNNIKNSDDTEEIKDIYVKLADERLIAVYNYGSETELFGVVLEKRGINNIFDFNAYFTLPADYDFAANDISAILPDKDDEEVTEPEKSQETKKYGYPTYLSILETYNAPEQKDPLSEFSFYKEAATDSYSPYVVNAMNNADGDRPMKLNFTGGNHGFDDVTNEGPATGSTVGVLFYIDGEIYTEYTGYASDIEIYFENAVQGSNTIKADGTGRSVITEANLLKFDGEKWKSSIMVTALEDVAFYRYYGLQFDTTGFGDKVSFVYDDERTCEDYLGLYLTSPDNECRTIRVSGDKFNVEIGMLSDLGTCNETSYSAFAETYKKTYFNIINANDNPLHLNAEQSFTVEGYYKFEAQY